MNQPLEFQKILNCLEAHGGGRPVVKFQPPDMDEEVGGLCVTATGNCYAGILYNRNTPLAHSSVH